MQDEVDKTKQDFLLKVSNLSTHFRTERGIVKAVDDVSFTLKRGETIGIVGESGSGKSVTALSLMQLIPNPPGKIAHGTVEFNHPERGVIDLLKLNNKGILSHHSLLW